MKIKLFSGVLCTSLLILTSAHSAVVTYLNANSFQATLEEGFYTEEFNSFSGGEYGSGDFSFEVFAISSEGQVDSGGLYGGGGIISTNTGNQPLRIEFGNNNVTAVGGIFFLSDALGNFEGDGETIDFYINGSQTVSAQIVMNSSQAPFFIGFTSDEVITSLFIDTSSVTGDFINIESLTVGSSIPEPGTYALWAGFGAFGLAYLRRRKA